jgi:hypothetical protein
VTSDDKLRVREEEIMTTTQDFYRDNARLVVRELFPTLSAGAQTAFVELLCDFLGNLDTIAVSMEGLDTLAVNVGVS